MIHLTWKTQFQSLWNPLLYMSLFVQAVMPAIGETTHHLTIRIKEHLATDKKSHVFAHNENCKELHLKNCFEIIDFASTSFRLHCVKSVQIRSFFWSVFSCIQSEYRKIRTRKNSVFGHFSCSVKANRSYAHNLEEAFTS